MKVVVVVVEMEVVVERRPILLVVVSIVVLLDPDDPEVELFLNSSNLFFIQSFNRYLFKKSFPK